jgi:hypothetical protein
MALLSFIAMYLPMYAMVDDFDIGSRESRALRAGHASP